MRRALLFAVLVLGCSSGESTTPASLADTGVDTSSDAQTDTASPCTGESCSGPGMACVKGACVEDCRHASADACDGGAACDFTDGKCKAPTSACFLPAAFDPCPDAAGSTARQCGPGTMCDGKGACTIPGNGCTGLECDDAGRCWATGCPCERPAPRCSVASLDALNKGDFAGPQPTNDQDSEGAFDLDFDDLCTAYTATMISGADFVRQLQPDGTLTTWQSTTNLNMGQVAVLRIPGGEFKELGDVAATYICCATCGCVETGDDGRLGVIRLDRASATRPLPNVLPAKPTTGAGPFGLATLDTGPYGLTWGADRALYAGNVEANGDFVRVDLEKKTTSPVTTFPARVTAATIYDLRRLLVAVEGGEIFLLETKTGEKSSWASLDAHVTSVKRDKFSGRVYAEVATTPPKIVEISPDGKTVTDFQTPPRLGRIAIAPDNHLYHLSVFPNVQWKTTKDAIVRWPLPSTR